MPDTLKRMRRKKTVLWLPGVINKFTLFTFLLSLMIFLFYILGNFQQFTDETQDMLLRIFRYAALIFMVTGLYNLVADIVIVIRKHQFYALRFILTLSGEVFIISVFIGISILLNISKGG